jgi:hypothetical protein
MTHDPWSLHASLSCPACHVTGKVVQNEAEAYDEFEAPFVCCECGQAWRDAGMMGDDSLRECRVNMMRLVEGRPYEPPKPKEPAPTKIDLTKLTKTSHPWPPFAIVADPAIPPDTVLMTSHPWTTLGDWMDRARELGEDEPDSFTVTGVFQRNGIITVRFDKK